MNHQQEPQSHDDARVRVTSKIWALSLGAMALSIPAADITHSALVPVLAVLSPAIATAAVWFFGGKNRAPAPAKNELAAQQRIAELEERLSNLETINNFERRLAEESLRRRDDAPAIPSHGPNSTERALEALG